MARIDFPKNPGIGSPFTAGNKTWIFDGLRWLIQARTGLPPISSVIHYANSEAAMIALPAVQGDIAVRTDLIPNKTFQLKTPTSTLFIDWQAVGFTDQEALLEYGVLVVDLNPAVNDINADTNAHDYTGHPHEDSAFPGNLRIENSHVVTFANGTKLSWRWFGPKPVSIGLDTTATDYRVVIPGDLQLVAEGILLETNEVIDTANLILAPYEQGDVRVLMDTDSNPAGTYRSMIAELVTGDITHWVLIAPDDYGAL